MQDFRTALDGKEDVFIDFDFRDLGLRLKEGKTILKGVNGMIRSKKLTAIMGPSGCGKTTFMSVLMGKVARTSGKLLINNDECEMSKYKKIIGYVPQEDIMLRELTVRENIYHSARVRLPNNWTGVQVNKFVDNVLEVLNLTHVQHNLIGSESERGISGGQRKRVNIGMELAGVPIALFLDEPTSGLDSTSSLKVAEILRKIASLGLTVVSVIHQPRYEIFQQFNDLLMLVPGGKTAYIGPTCFVVEYFKELGYFFDALANPADILMDILSGKGIHLRDEHITSDGLVEKWESFGKSWVDAKIAAGEKEDHTLHTPEECTASTRDLEGIVKKRGSSIFTQIALCHNRYLIQQYRRAGSLAIEIGVASLAGGLMGIAIMGQDGMIFKGVIVAPYEALTPSTITWLIPQLGLLIGMACSLAGAPAGVKVFAEEQTVYWREAANGHNKAAYFTGKALSSIYRFVLSSLHFTAIFAVLGLPSAPFEFIYACILLQFWCVYGLAMVVSMIVRREDSALLAVVVCLFSAVFCGYGPTIKDSYSMGITFIFHMSYNRWATEAWFSKELSIFEGVYKIEDAAEGFGYVLNKEGMNLLLCFVIGVVLRAKAFALMVLLHRDKQK
ncbi:P-loop containing nucleoside triphosphate hydrolase protein [Obelidium mucronatum]|nr:P-loop containing nucleoside triphosphate hydrolase protein [Obelidium mucronatum]